MEQEVNTGSIDRAERKKLAIQLIRELRIKLDAYIRATQGLVFMCIPKFKLGMTKQEEEMYAYYRDNPKAEPSLELTQAEFRLKEAKAYTGKLIGLLSGDGTPYKNDGLRKTVKDIEPEADKLEGIFEVCKVSGILGIYRVDTDMVVGSMERVSPVMRIDYLRQEIQLILSEYCHNYFDRVQEDTWVYVGKKKETETDEEFFIRKNMSHLASAHKMQDTHRMIHIITQKLEEARFYYGWALGEIRDMYHFEDTEVL